VILKIVSKAGHDKYTEENRPMRDVESRCRNCDAAFGTIIRVSKCLQRSKYKPFIFIIFKVGTLIRYPTDFILKALKNLVTQSLSVLVRLQIYKRGRGGTILHPYIGTLLWFGTDTKYIGGFKNHTMTTFWDSTLIHNRAEFCETPQVRSRSKFCYIFYFST
jgi:hypothetical protein